MGLALSGRELDWLSYFLNASNHQAGTPLDYASFHFYATANTRTDPLDFTRFFAEADGFLQEAKAIQELRDKVAPQTKLSCDEMGVILPDDNDPTAPVPPPVYW